MIYKLDKYQELLREVAAGEGTILGYSNLEKKISAENRQMIVEYRDSIVDKNRIDRFIVPNTETNIQMVEDHFSKTQWSEHLFARFIDKKIFDVPCDLYVWDGKVGISFFGTSEISVKLYDDPILYQIVENALKLLWGISLDKVVYFGPRTSDLTKAEKEAYLCEEEILDLGAAYPHNLNPEWIDDYIYNLPRETFANANPRDLISKIQHYFAELFHGEASHVQLTPSATYSFLVAVDVLVETPGDELIMLDPGYDSYPNIVRSMGGNVIYANRNQDGAPDVDDIISKITDRTVALVLCSPDNPSGKVFSEKELLTITKLCTKHSITLVLDQSFKQLHPFAEKVPTPSISNPDLHSIVIGDAGKSLGLAGSKFGALIYSRNFHENIQAKTDVYFFQLNKYDLFVISNILGDERFPDYLENFNSLLRDNYEFLRENLPASMTVLPVEGSSVCLVDVSGTGRNDIMVTNIAKENGLAVIPASFFYSGTGEVNHSFIRIALARRKQQVAKTVEILARISKAS